MIHINNHDITGVYSGLKDIVAVYSGLKLVWQKIAENTEILSCYSNGYWIDEYPWTDETPWTDEIK
jgi:hypothetical protein